jgi:hypothetical protein
MEVPEKKEDNLTDNLTGVDKYLLHRYKWKTRL